MHIQIIQVPYDSGHRAERMGRGPIHFIENKIDETFQAEGWDVAVEIVESQRPFRAEIYTGFELARSISERVWAARENGAFPLVLSGNCNSSLGTIPGSDPQDIGLVWFDAHGEFNTPESTEGGFLDGMGLAVLTGRCWTTMAHAIPNFAPIPDNRALMIGVRDLDEQERKLLAQSDVAVIGVDEIRQTSLSASLTEPLSRLRALVSRVYIHIDADSLDPQVGIANGWAVPNGLLLEELEEALSMVAEQFEIVSATFASYDPAFDTDNRMLEAATHIMKHLLKSAADSRSQ